MEKVIKGLECCSSCTCGGCPYTVKDDPTATCMNLLSRDALELLKAQEPVKPVVDIDTLKCGNCGHTLEHQALLGDNVLFHEQYNCCPDCGRKVKWDD